MNENHEMYSKYSSLTGTNLTVSVGATWSTYLLSGESATVSEGISSGSPGTPAYGHMVLHCAVGTLPTRDGTRVDALVVLTGSLRSTVLVLIALSLSRMIDLDLDT